MKQRNKRHNGFSLVEILVVVSTSALLVGLLIPSVQTARQQARRAACLNNLRQIALAAAIYADVYDEHYPLAYHTEKIGDTTYFRAWDFDTWKDWSGVTPVEHVEPGILWMGQTSKKTHQCPAFRGSANWFKDPYTGYNYNISYIGLNETIRPVDSTKTTEVRSPVQTALFGDGEYIGGANKFMRAPLENPRDASFSNGFRHAGAQGFRHLHTTNVVFCDGHAGFLRDVYTQTNQTSRTILEDHNRTHQNKIGFLSEDNRLYDLE
jgi:prepilin-type processing-associated H-X9-DG protein